MGGLSFSYIGTTKYFFYSLGQAPETYHQHFRNPLSVNGPQYRVSRCPVQPDYSQTCGLNCAFYVKMKCQSIKLTDVLNDFSSDDLDAKDSNNLVHNRSASM